ncbi:hypothetical protein [Mycoplasmopsis bovirhinis]|uniref:Uncharacterized protein n=1 Tax=Mycoplasmopsis bovirhinis TaxID=29553 RepID=A0A449ADJ4_9BACT|nr:hypothetical protein [Mycoplasmopsis bovirhinis]VEU63051.1 Uncharacterised protein [Mycoplasmopsis bovirhinis]
MVNHLRKKKKVLDYTWIDTLKDDEKDAVIKYYYRIFNENNIDADIKEIDNLSSKKESKHFFNSKIYILWEIERQS